MGSFLFWMKQVNRLDKKGIEEDIGTGYSVPFFEAPMLLLLGYIGILRV